MHLVQSNLLGFCSITAVAIDSARPTPPRFALLSVLLLTCGKWMMHSIERGWRQNCSCHSHPSGVKATAVTIVKWHRLTILMRISQLAVNTPGHRFFGAARNCSHQSPPSAWIAATCIVPSKLAASCKLQARIRRRTMRGSGRFLLANLLSRPPPPGTISGSRSPPTYLPALLSTSALSTTTPFRSRRLSSVRPIPL